MVLWQDWQSYFLHLYLLELIKKESIYIYRAI